MNNTIVDQILDLPNAASIVEEVRFALDEEKKQRLDFYNWITPKDKAEFINGEIIIHSPVKLQHASAGGRLFRLLSDFVEENDLGYVGYEKLMISLTRNDYEPDVVYFSKEKTKGFKEDMSRFPAPDLAIEVISKGTETRDRGVKFQDYGDHGISEYWIVDPKSQTIEQYLLERSKYKLNAIVEPDGAIQSYVIPGLSFSIHAVFDQIAYKAARKALGI